MRDTGSEMANVIDQFMWSWQQHFRISVGVLATMALEQIGARLDAQVVLVGLTEEPRAAHAICVEPETGPLRPGALTGVRDRAVEIFREDPRSNVWHSNADVQASRQAYLRNSAMGAAIAEAIEASEALGEKRVFGSVGGRVGTFEVHVIVAVDRPLYDALPALEEVDLDGWPAPISLPRQVIDLVLREADLALRTPEPNSSDIRRSPQDVIRESAERFCAGCLYRTRNFDLSSAFNAINAVTGRAYEGAGASGRFLLVAPDHEELVVMSALAEVVPLGAARGIRKLLQTADAHVALLVHNGGVYGLGGLETDSTSTDVFEIVVTAHATWELRGGGESLLRVAYGRPALPRPTFDATVVSDTLERVFGGDADTSGLLALIKEAAEARHGTTLAISANAAAEATRLAGSATLLVSATLNEDLLHRYAEMDGAVLIDPNGLCHAVGVILDGQAHGRGDPARGARYNSALRYQASATYPTVVVVVSEDGDVDVVPHPRLRVRRQVVIDAITRLEASLESETPAEFSKAFDAVKRLSFYLSEQQCQRVNEMTKAEQDRRMAAGYMTIVWETLKLNPEMDDSYFSD